MLKKILSENFSLFEFRFENGSPTQLEFVLLFGTVLPAGRLLIDSRYHLLFDGGHEYSTSSTRLYGNKLMLIVTKSFVYNVVLDNAWSVYMCQVVIIECRSEMIFK